MSKKLVTATMLAIAATMVLEAAGRGVMAYRRCLWSRGWRG